MNIGWQAVRVTVAVIAFVLGSVLIWQGQQIPNNDIRILEGLTFWLIALLVGFAHRF